MEIKIDIDAELNSLLDAIAGEITDAHCNWRLFCKLGDSITDYVDEFAQSNTFWHLTITALKESTLLHLCRVYDQEVNSLSLASLLDTLKANLDRFSKEQFKTRLAGNAFVESLAESNRIPHVDEIEADIKLATCENETVKKLIIWRSCIIAHRGAKASMGKNQVLVDNPISQQEIEFLLKNALATFNKYSSLFRASTNSPNMVGHDDYKSVLNYIRVGLQQRRRELETA